MAVALIAASIIDKNIRRLLQIVNVWLHDITAFQINAHAKIMQTYINLDIRSCIIAAYSRDDEILLTKASYAKRNIASASISRRTTLICISDKAAFH